MARSDPRAPIWARPLQRLPVQITVAALIPIMLVSLAISMPLIAGGRAQLRDLSHLRAVQAGQTTELLAQEQIRFAARLINLLADQLVLIESIDAGDRLQVQAWVYQTRSDTLFDLVTIVDPAGQVLAQDGMARLWRPELPAGGAPVFWGAPGLGLVAQVAVPLTPAMASRGMLIGSFLVDRAPITLVRSQADLEQRILVDGRLVASSLLAPGQPPHPLLASAASAPAEVAIAQVPYLAVSTPLHAPDGATIATIEILTPLTPLRTAQERATLVLLAGTLIATTAATLLGWVLARRIARPIAELAQAAERIGRGDLDRPVTIAGPAEIRLLSTTIEWMRRQIALAQAALEAEKTRYANVLESITEAVITTDESGAITSINRGAEQLFGRRREQTSGRALGSLIWLPDDLPLTLHHIPTTGGAQLVVTTSAGARLTVAATRSTITSDAHTGEHVLVIRDVSDEAALVQLKEAFLANITHELRTPLAAMIASLELLSDEQEPLSAAEHRQMLHMVQLGVRRLDTLVQNLLDSASLQAGYFRVEPEPGQLPPLIDEAIQLIHPLTQQRAQCIQLDLPELTPPVMVDGRRIIQVLVNLLSNASKFGPMGDTLQVRVSPCPDRVEVRVTDHGAGIPGRRRPRLFDRFLRPGEETVAAQGVGLGLAIARAIVERHGGQIWVEDLPMGPGTTFVFTLRLV